MSLHFNTNYDLALFIIRILVLPVIIGCAFVALIRAFKGAPSRTFSLAYQFAVFTTIVSLIFYIADTARYASAPTLTRGTLPRVRANYVRPLIILDVFVATFDFIARIATFILVTQLAIDLADARRRILQLLRFLVVIILALIVVIDIAFRGRFADLTLRTPLLTGLGFNDTYIWASRFSDVDTAFFAVYLLGVIVVLVMSISLSSGSLRAALFQLLLISIFALASAGGTVSFWSHFLAQENNYDFNEFNIYTKMEVILEVFLQTGILVVLLFASAPAKQPQARPPSV